MKAKLVKETLNESINESIVNDADKILDAVRQKNQKGYRHLYKNLANYIGKDIPNFDNDIDEAAYILAVIMKKNYGDNWKSYISDKDVDEGNNKNFNVGAVLNKINSGKAIKK